jgi:hypothetical protein
MVINDRDQGPEVEEQKTRNREQGSGIRSKDREPGWRLYHVDESDSM